MLVALLVVFAATRVAAGAVADHPGRYEHGGSIVGDVILYQDWGEQIVDQGRVPYRDIPIEYPPGALPFFAVPALAPGSLYRPLFVVSMLLVDVVGLVALLRLARRRGSTLGPWLWVVLVPLLGPISYLRFDLVAAVATIWMVELLSRSRWTAAGISLGLGIVVKLYPVVLLAPLLALPRLRRPIAVGAGAVVVAALLPFAAWPRDVIRTVVRYHLDREIEIESLWGALLLVAGKAGGAVRLEFSSESLNVVSSASSTLEAIAALAIVAALALAVLAAVRLAATEQEERLPDVLFATLACVVAVGTVLSPQYLLWLIALGAAAVCSAESIVRTPVLLLAPVTAMTQLLFPFLYVRLARMDDAALALLAARNILLIGLAAWAVAAVVRSDGLRRGGTRSDAAAAEEGSPAAA
jgi:Glycosyltransferase family 87